MDTETDWEVRDPVRYRRAHELLMMERPKNYVVLQLISPSFSEDDATSLVEQAWQEGRGARHEEGTQEVVRGLVMLIGGIVGNVVLSQMLAQVHSPIWIVFWGIPLYGAGYIYWGSRKLSS